MKRKLRGGTMRVLSALACAALMAGLLGMAAFAAGSEKEAVIRVFHTNDVHARYDATIGESGYLEGFGYARMKTLIERNSAGADRVLVFDAGDTFHGQPFATLNQGESVARVMAAVGYDAMAAGNHDFNYGYERTAQLRAMAGADLLAANVKQRNGMLPTGFKAYQTYEVNGVKIGVFGLSTPETAYKTNPKNVGGIRFADTVETARKMTDTLRRTEKCDVVICLSHLGIDPSSGSGASVYLAGQAPGIDLIIDGHSHSAPDQYPEEVNGTVVVSAGEYLQHLGMATIRVSGKDVSVESAPLAASDFSADDLPPNAGIQKAVDQIKAGQQPLLDKKIASSPVTLNGERERVRTGDTNLSRIITSAMLDETGADAALTNGGGIRASVPAGDITVGGIQNVLPFGNYIVTVKLTGRELREAVEHGLPGNIDGSLEPIGSYCQFAGLEISYDPWEAKGSRLTSITTPDGRALDDEKEYIVATNDFMATGGDGYTMLNKPIVNEFSALDEAVVRYINKIGRAGIVAAGSERRVAVAVR